jgi:hypothetical protein
MVLVAKFLLNLCFFAGTLDIQLLSNPFNCSRIVFDPFVSL